MGWTRTHPLERVAEWGAPMILALAAGWAAKVAGLALAAVAVCAMLALTLGVIAMRTAGRTPAPQAAGFEPVELEASDPDDELLLDDPLVEMEADSRVVQLFDHQEATPGELVLRISDYLNDGNRPAPADATPSEQQYPDASDALHAALANIRASLR